MSQKKLYRLNVVSYMKVKAVFPLAIFLRQMCHRQRHLTDIIVLTLATLGDATQIEMILSVLRAAVIDVFAYKHRQCTGSLSFRLT